ncbi:MAG: protein translocase subunit SecF [Myxococcota bacterium]|nr:protein translocase subunit SecF [Myxococcota bacterium]
MQFIKPGTRIDFVGKRAIAAVFSALLVIVSIALFLVQGPNWGIDFTGGNEIQVQFVESLPAGSASVASSERVPLGQAVPIGDLRGALENLGVSGDSVQQLGAPEENRFSVRIQDPTFGTEGVEDEIVAALVAKFSADWGKVNNFVAEIGSKATVEFNSPTPVAEIKDAIKGIDGARVRKAPDDNSFYIELPGLSSKITDSIRTEMGGRDFITLSTDSVGPKVGGELRKQGFIAIASTLALILVYVAFRFDLAFAPGAVLALFHDVTIVVGIFVLTQREFNLPMIGALLTIIGYSLNDTIVIYDRIRENMTRYRRRDMAQLINDSINETMSRTLATSLTTALGMTAFLLLGGPVIETFALAILIGVFVGTYSTIFVASPTILVMQDLRPHLEKLFSPLSSDEPDEGEGEEGEALTATEQRRRARQGEP